MKRFAVNNFKKLGDDQLVTEVKTIIEAMTVNVVLFATPSPALADVQIALTDFEGKLAVSRRRGNPMETSVKNESKLVLAELMRKLAFYVNDVAAGTLSVLLASGFKLNQSLANGLPPETPDGLRLREGRQKGQIRLDFSPVATARAYEYRFTSQLTSDGKPVWDERFHTTTSFNNVLSPVEAGLTYYVQVRALNAHGASDWSYVLDYIGR
ncbi:hypothetical protein SAMN05216436_11154 [bacterium A37T11]|nr:hypothetical protein SAMN05216436_11154 [bacterium A37T11]